MAVNWGLAGEGFNALETLKVAGAAQNARLQQQKQQAELAKQQRELRTSQQAGALAAQGNFNGARSTALNDGNFAFAKEIDALEENQRKTILSNFEQLGQQALLADTPEKWDQAVQTAVRQGNPEAQAYLGQFGLREQIIARAGLAKEYADRMKPVTLPDGAQLYRSDGSLIAENAPEAKYQAVPEGGMLVRTDGGNARAVMGGPSQGASGAVPGPVTFNGVPGERVTSTFRTPERNAAVGGVGNSYHTRRDAQGNALARDSVPPPGMSMTQYAAVLRRENPGMDVINEGDHVHIEPRSSAQARNAAPDVIYGRPKTVAPKERYRTLSRQETAAQGLDPNTRYQQGPNGQITAIGGQTRPNSQSKPLRQGDGDKLEAQVGGFAALKNAVSSFDDRYAGNVLGDVENMMQGISGNTGTPGQRDWWAAFGSTDNQIRNELFGASLTAGEKSAYASTTINPRMAPSEIRRNLQRRVGIIRGALNRKVNRLKAAGYSKEEIDATMGEYQGDITAQSGQRQQAKAPDWMSRVKITKVN